MIEIKADTPGRFGEVLSEDALDFLDRLHREFDPVRCGLLEERGERQQAILSGSFRTSCPRPDRYGTATGRSRRFPPISKIGASRSPARPIAR